MGPESQIRYFMVSKPVITKDYIALDINVSASLSSLSRGWLPLESLVFWKVPKRAGMRRREDQEWHSRSAQDIWRPGLGGLSPLC